MYCLFYKFSWGGAFLKFIYLWILLLDVYRWAGGVGFCVALGSRRVVGV
ncbi:hypothetical protein P186_0853 [Pyrobaculum ferrireducens]|uniref:Uncharacterized protein n=1 Tax=Pyrobaculum ferrireducens TaxID=1104324 RepID=G7VAY5_9CREN|nr:hypothetical protein P186_0853 [Pyrobaculum ferrireducens]